MSDTTSDILLLSLGVITLLVALTLFGEVMCQRRLNFPQKCRSKIPHYGSFGDQPVSVIGASILVFRRPSAALGRWWRRDGSIRPDMLWNEVGMGA